LLERNKGPETNSVCANFSNITIFLAKVNLLQFKKPEREKSEMASYTTQGNIVTTSRSRAQAHIAIHIGSAKIAMSSIITDNRCLLA